MPSRALLDLRKLDAPELVVDGRDSAQAVMPNAVLEVHALHCVPFIVLDHDVVAACPLHWLATLTREDRDEGQVLSLVRVLPQALLSEPQTLAAHPPKIAYEADARLARVPVTSDPVHAANTLPLHLGRLARGQLHGLLLGEIRAAGLLHDQVPRRGLCEAHAGNVLKLSVHVEAIEHRHCDGAGGGQLLKACSKELFEHARARMV
mmetsp:Transcript_25207/g.67008  ORF Transcript_25207/g.67008 Transcript_25207/m.67008 type:complete len:206 (+) Transcript_25207:1-618(+)